MDGLTWRATRQTSIIGSRICMHGSDGERTGRANMATIHPESGWQPAPLALVALEDKIVQRATAALLNAIYEEDFLGFSYGFRRGRSQHDALDALVVGISSRKVNHILDADIRSFFDAVSQTWLIASWNIGSATGASSASSRSG